MVDYKLLHLQRQRQGSCCSGTVQVYGPWLLLLTDRSTGTGQPKPFLVPNSGLFTQVTLEGAALESILQVPPDVLSSPSVCPL